jgi:hypothetical protein
LYQAASGDTLRKEGRQLRRIHPATVLNCGYDLIVHTTWCRNAIRVKAGFIPWGASISGSQ